LGVTIRDLGSGVSYEPTWRAMQRYTDERDSAADDELWLLEHDPVFTLGQNARPEHVLAAGEIPVVNVDRGGQVTYHGPGQVVAYPLVDLRRRGIGVRAMVTIMETSVIRLAAEQGIDAQARSDAPGVYVGEAKLAAVGLRVRRGCSYHGLALNVAMDLSPFGRIDPCGYAGMPVTDLQSLGATNDINEIKHRLASILTEAIEAGTRA
jgi:lipoyl(octanoyl) transferase